MKRTVLLVVLVLASLLVGLASLAVVNTAYAVLKVNVCHNTGSPSNPYVLVVVSVQSVEDAINLGGHGQHEDDAWHSYVFEDITYPARNEWVFGSLVDDNCNLIEPTSTPTNTEVPSATPTATSTSTATATPTDTYTPTPTQTEVSTSTPTSTPIDTSTPTMTPTTDPGTSTPVPATATPKPPKPAMANSMTAYPSPSIGNFYIEGKSYALYNGQIDVDGTLMLPSIERGGALYNNAVWVHRAWNSGWLHLKVGDTVTFFKDDSITTYKVGYIWQLPYGVYPADGNFYIATCMSADDANWTNVELFRLDIVRIVARKGR